MPRTTTPADQLVIIELHIGILRRELKAAPDLRRSILARRSIVAIREAAKAAWAGDSARREKAPSENAGRPTASGDGSSPCQACKQRRNRLKRKQSREAGCLKAERSRSRQLAAVNRRPPSWSPDRWREFFGRLHEVRGRIDCLLAGLEDPELAPVETSSRWLVTRDRLDSASAKLAILCRREHPDLVADLAEDAGGNRPDPSTTRWGALAEAQGIFEAMGDLSRESQELAEPPGRVALGTVMHRAGLARFWMGSAGLSARERVAGRRFDSLS